MWETCPVPANVCLGVAGFEQLVGTDQGTPGADVEFRRLPELDIPNRSGRLPKRAVGGQRPGRGDKGLD